MPMMTNKRCSAGHADIFRPEHDRGQKEGSHTSPPITSRDPSSSAALLQARPPRVYICPLSRAVASTPPPYPPHHIEVEHLHSHPVAEDREMPSTVNGSPTRPWVWDAGQPRTSTVHDASVYMTEGPPGRERNGAARAGPPARHRARTTTGQAALTLAPSPP